ncbi:hypothetical protein cyc_06290 [Cyclospora cayetanensis]|uniref:Uncharacterized protein n=1 Tax=Cyclospora cayetanensis TaxID=88456 RepID=A0A1D3CZE4_9EIME|nr:hypothetical protein cyc_06290 [Cyclospora cayetanensis]
MKCVNQPYSLGGDAEIHPSASWMLRVKDGDGGKLQSREGDQVLDASKDVLQCRLKDTSAKEPDKITCCVGQKTEIPVLEERFYLPGFRCRRPGKDFQVSIRQYLTAFLPSCASTCREPETAVLSSATGHRYTIMTFNNSNQVPYPEVFHGLNSSIFLPAFEANILLTSYAKTL